MTTIQMPQLGETIVEGTILKWLKQEGEHIERDEPLFEISTDKVDTEVPSPVSGTVTKILAAEGATVAVKTDIAEIEEDGAGAAPAASEPASQAPAASEPSAPAAPASQRRRAPPRSRGGGGHGRRLHRAGSRPPIADPLAARAPPRRRSRHRPGHRDRHRDGRSHHEEGRRGCRGR